MDKKFELSLPGIVAYGDNLKALENLAKSADMDYEGRLAWCITDTGTGEVMSYQKGGLDVTLNDLDEIARPTVRLHNAVLRHLQEVTGFTIDDICQNVTMRDIRDMVIDGFFVDLRNVGMKTRIEFYQLLIEFCGNTWLTRFAINKNIVLHMIAAENRNPAGPWGGEMQIHDMFYADLSDPYYKRYFN